MSTLCYTEFVVAMPAAGRVSVISSQKKGLLNCGCLFVGEFLAYIIGTNLIMEYVVSNAAVARSFTSYFGSAIGSENVDKWCFKVHDLSKGLNKLDLIAFSLVIVLTICIFYMFLSSHLSCVVMLGLFLG